MSKEIWTNDQINQLIQEINNGNKESAKQLIANYADDIHFQAALYNSEKEEVSQSFQKACNHAIKNISSIDLNDPEKWFAAAAAEAAVNTSIELETADSTYDPSDEHIDTSVQLPESKSEVRKAVLNAMVGLTAAERTAFALRFYEHLDNSEVAQKLRTDTKQIEALLANAKSRLVQKELSVPAIITAMNYLNPGEDDEAVAAPVIFPAVETAVKPVKKLPGTKTLYFALAGVIIAAILFIAVSGKLNHSQTNTADGTPKTQETQNGSDKTGSDNTAGSGSSQTSSNENDKSDNDTHLGLVIEDEIVENISSSGNGSSSNANSGENTNGDTQSGDSSSTITPTPDTVSGESDNPPSEDGGEYDTPDEEIDIGNGDIIGGF